MAGKLEARRLVSTSLGIRKPYYVYEPPSESKLGPPQAIVYLLRGHEREWVNIDEDDTRASTAIEDIDTLIQRGNVPPIVAVMPGLNSANNVVPSLGIDMTGRWPATLRGLGTGRFWQYLTTELIPQVESRYGSDDVRARIAIGFSLGGYTAALLATKMAGYLDHACIYDGTLPFQDLDDPRTGTDDRIWMAGRMFDAALGRRRSRNRVSRWNPSQMLADAPFHQLYVMRKTTFWISGAARDGQEGNRDRAASFERMLVNLGIRSGFASTVFDAKAEHTWHWADRFAADCLQSALGD